MYGLSILAANNKFPDDILNNISSTIVSCYQFHNLNYRHMIHRHHHLSRPEINTLTTKWVKYYGLRTLHVEYQNKSGVAVYCNFKRHVCFKHKYLIGVMSDKSYHKIYTLYINTLFYLFFLL